MPDEEKKPDQEDIAEDAYVDLELYINIIDKFGPLGKPALMLRKVTGNRYEIQHLLAKAYRKEPIVTRIIIKDEVLAIPKLARLGLIDPQELEKLF